MLVVVYVCNFVEDVSRRHHVVKLSVVDEPVSVDVGLVDDLRDLLFRHCHPQRPKHHGKLAPVNVPIAVLSSQGASSTITATIDYYYYFLKRGQFN